MKKKFRNLVMPLFVAAACTGCADEIAVENGTVTTTKGTTLIASTGDDTPQTRIDFTDNGANGIDLKWSAGDEFTVVKKSDGKIVGNFALKSGKGSAQGVFEAIDNFSLENNTDYITIYPAISTAVTAKYDYFNHPTTGYIANGNKDMTQLNDMLYMEVQFKHNEAEVGTQIAFKHKYAMLTIKLPAGAITETPAKVSMHSSLNHYSDVQFINVDPSSEIRAYTMMKTASGTSDLTFAVTTTTGKVYTQTINSSKQYVAGKRYTATLDNLTELATAVDLASFSSSTPTGDIWVITDSGTPNASSFEALCTQFTAINNSGRKIELVFPSIQEIPSLSMRSLTSLASISLPQATSIGQRAFEYDANLSSIYAPKAKTISSNTFSSTGLTSIYLPEATSIPSSSFYTCSSLTTAYLPKVTSVEGYAFGYCKSLKTLTLGTEATLTTLQTNIFFEVPTLKGITLFTNCGTVSNNSWTVGSQTYGPFKKIDAPSNRLSHPVISKNQDF